MQQQRLAPASPLAIAEALDCLQQLYLPPAGGSWEDAADWYLEALEDVPPDLVEPTMRELRLTHRFSTAPTPGDIRAAIPGEVEQRRRDLRGLATMLAAADTAERREARHCERDAELLAELKALPGDEQERIHTLVKRLTTGEATRLLSGRRQIRPRHQDLQAELTRYDLPTPPAYAVTYARLGLAPAQLALPLATTP